jgi:hypothetical protein
MSRKTTQTTGTLIKVADRLHRVAEEVLDAVEGGITDNTRGKWSRHRTRVITHAPRRGTHLSNPLRHLPQHRFDRFLYRPVEGLLSPPAHRLIDILGHFT